MRSHSVFFTLKSPAMSPQAQQFLADAQVLATIPTVQRFEQVRQVSATNGFQYGFIMAFDDQAAYDAYTVHPLHERFVRERWQVEVAAFLEIDHVPL